MPVGMHVCINKCLSGNNRKFGTHLFIQFSQCLSSSTCSKPCIPSRFGREIVISPSHPLSFMIECGFDP